MPPLGQVCRYSAGRIPPTVEDRAGDGVVERIAVVTDHCPVTGVVGVDSVWRELTHAGPVVLSKRRAWMTTEAFTLMEVCDA